MTEYCAKCGEKLKDDAVFCGNCGAKVPNKRKLKHLETLEIYYIVVKI